MGQPPDSRPGATPTGDAPIPDSQTQAIEAIVSAAVGGHRRRAGILTERFTVNADLPALLALHDALTAATTHDKR